jgi:hypothetical protein
MYKVYKPSTYLVVTYFPNYLPIYIGPTYRMGYQDETRYEFSWGSSTTESKWASSGWCAGGLLLHSGPTANWWWDRRWHTQQTHILLNTHIYAYHMQLFSTLVDDTMKHGLNVSLSDSICKKISYFIPWPTKVFMRKQWLCNDMLFPPSLESKYQTINL